MKPIELLSKNHDTHFHSQLSDSNHPVVEVARYVSRWQTAPKWAGLSDHSPQTGEQVRDYLNHLIPFRQELLEKNGITLLAGMELECSSAGIDLDKDALTGLDYGIASYHGISFSTPTEVEQHFSKISGELFADVIGHADKFLGKVDVLSINWEAIFHHFHKHSNLLEYNLTTPLQKEILDIAIQHSDVEFTISSDMHDFRDIATRRIVDAWSESLGGGYSASFQYLLEFLKLEFDSKVPIGLIAIFNTNARMNDFQKKVYLRSKGILNSTTLLNEEEDRLMSVLSKFPENEIDKDFISFRLERFSKVEPDRIVSLLPLQGFRNKLKAGRNRRTG